MRRYKIIITLLIVLAVIISFQFFTAPKSIIEVLYSGDVEEISKFISDAGVAAILISILFNVIISVMGVIPSVFLTGANILVFGFSGGFLVSWAGEVIGAVISFLLYRFGFKSIFKISSDHWKVLRTINILPGKKQIYFMAVLRLAPFFPSGVINLFGALTSITLINFFIATALGKFPALLLESAFSYNLLTISKNYINFGVSILVAVFLYFLVKREFVRLKSYNKN